MLRAKTPAQEPALLEGAELERLMEEHGRAVLALAFSYLRDAVLAEDVFQEVFARAFRSGATIRDPRRTRAWLLSVTANLCRDNLRSWSRRSLVLVAEPPERPGGATPLDALSARESDRELAEAVLALSRPLREVVVLRHYEGLSAGETARVLGIGTVTVRTRLYRARRELARVLTEEVSHDA